MMRLVLAGAAALAIVSTMTAANAADIQRKQAMPAKAPVYAAPYNWTGTYIGINGGAGWGRSNFSAPFATGNFNTSGGQFGGTLGVNYQVNSAVFGLETDLDWSNVKGSAACGVGLTCETKNTWLGTARGRIGYAFDRFLPYFTGGLAYGGVKNSITGLGDSTTTKVGWTLGGGLEAAIAGPWTAKVEYLYADLGRASAPGGSDASSKTNIVRGGLNYRF